MNLYEEFKLYEKLWDTSSLPKAKANKPAPEEFFKAITGTEKLVKKFIKELLAPAVKGRANFDITTAYHGVIAANSNADNLSVTRNPACNFAAFSELISQKFSINRGELRELVKNGNEPVNQNPALKKPRRYGHISTAGPKDQRPTAEEYFNKMTGSRDSIIAFIKEHLAPAVAGRAANNVGGAYYGALAKNTCEVSANIVQNTACNYAAFKKKLEYYSIGRDELSKLLEIDFKYQSAHETQKSKSPAELKKEKACTVIRDKLSEYITDSDQIDGLTQSIYAELAPLLRKQK